MNAKKLKPAIARPLRVLVADDDRDTVMMLTAILVDEGHTVHSVYRGDQVADAVRRHEPEVCILDIDMPGRNGYELARDLALTRSGSRPVLVAISGKYTRKSEQLLAQTVGFDRFFVKPAEPDELLAFLDDVARGGDLPR